MDQATTLELARSIAPVVQRFVGDAVRPLIERIAALEARPIPSAAKDGVGVAGVLRDRDGLLILTLSDGRVLNAGKVEDGAPGKDADLGVVAALVAAEVAKIPAPKDGNDADPQAVAEALKAEVAPLIRGLVDEALAASAPDDGERPDGEEIARIVAAEVTKAVAALPAPQNGVDGAPGAAGKDGLDGKDGAPGCDGIDGKDGGAGVNGSAGVGLAGALIDREGALVLTLTDGKAVPLGPVVGRDGADGAAGKDGSPGAPGKDGADGLGFDDLTVEHDGERGVVLHFVRGDQRKEFPLAIPAMIYRGVYKDGVAHERGDTVTWGGSLWHCDEPTAEKPGEGAKGWTLVAKRGRDGKPGDPGKPGERGLPGQKGEPGPRGYGG